MTQKETQKIWTAALAKLNELRDMMGDGDLTYDILDADQFLVTYGKGYWADEDVETLEFPLEAIVAEAEEYLSHYYEDDHGSGELKYDDPKAWRSETGKWKRFINKYSKYIE